MAHKEAAPGSLKRKRRPTRRADKAHISGHAHLDSKLKGEIALLSHDLVDDLFPASSADSGDIYNVAITPWAPSSVVADAATQWVIIPCRRLPRGHPDLPHSSIRISIFSHVAHALQRALHTQSPNRSLRPASTLEICLTQVVALPLDIVYVSLDSSPSESANKPQKSNANGSLRVSKAGKDKASARPAAVDSDQATRAVRDALDVVRVVRAGDVLSLTLARPQTQASASPALITACEPVSQGLIASTTQIVVVSQNERRKKASRSVTFSQPDEDTANESFYTAAEDGALSSANSPPADTVQDSDLASEDALSDLGDLSDDPDDMISLSSPSVGSQPSGILSARSNATPKLFGNPRGINTPGSVFSSMTSTTMRGAQGGRTKTFKTQGLLERIPDAFLHPKPGSQQDEEARVYVDTSALAKLGCFSGDWIQLQVAEDPASANSLMSFFRDPEIDENAIWRPLKIYGLPESLSVRTQKYPLNNKSGRRDSISSSHPISVAPATLHLSPVLLANLGNPGHVRVSSLRIADVSNFLRPGQTKSRFQGSSLPPTAKEVTLSRLSTPLSEEKSTQPSLFARLQDHFKQKQRIVKSGDLIAIPIDEALGKAVFEGGAADETNDILTHLESSLGNGSTKAQSRASAVAWFQIGDVSSPFNSDAQDAEEVGIWGGVVTIDPTETRMSQSGALQRKLPPTTHNSWEFYHGIRKVPRTAVSASSHLRTPPKEHVPLLQRRIRELMAAAMSPRAVHLGLPPLAILLTSTQRNIGKAYTVSRACHDLGAHVFSIDAYELVSEGAAGGGDTKTEGFLKARAERGLHCGAQHTSLLIRHLEALSSDRMAGALKDILADCRVLIATSTEVDKIPDAIRGLFTHELEMTAPDEAEREGILQSIIANSGLVISPLVDLSTVAVKTAALVAGDLVDVAERAVLNQATRLESLATAATASREQAISVRDIQLAGGDSATSLTSADFDKAVDDARKNFADSIGAPKIPNVQWSDVGGLANVKEAVIETIQLPLSRPELFAKGLKKRSGILFYGPPGTGKTLLAKAIATEFSLNFFSVKGPELLNMYIGESEANVRRVFQRARDARPCCVFFDELDSVAPKRGNQGDSGGVMDRIVSQLLAELDGMSDGDEGGGGVFVIGATNRPDLLDQALLRPGRFDKMLYLGISDTHEKQQRILEALSRKFTLDPELDLGRVAEKLPFTYTGADLYALCSDAMLKAITRSARIVDNRVAEINDERARRSPPEPPISVAYFFDHFATEVDTSVVVAEEDFMAAERELVPSVSADELGHYERVRREFEGGKEKEEKASQQPNGTGSRNINGKGKAIDQEFTDSVDEDFVIRTDHLSINGSGKGKGKARAEIPDGARFGEGADDEDMYA
ncbi:AAA-domain-containing protein [Aureobasidium namibiae CBS 147.97]|uniref:Peroxisomal ATPase PEX6 n=1 Tax=Aureobasidium namibiae CBS 147.97 TaxID=1043004 RepID=A0A074WSQ7_9PEZI|nr:AAA-domain-containing protein [Aureobasidium namibiae CBS 147.97]KEQ76215.1 AAA-domain-containing protein [Aureobasidium namibiae CBS 147.97]